MLLLLYEIYGLQLTKSEKGKKGRKSTGDWDFRPEMRVQKKHLSTTLTGMYSNIYDWIWKNMFSEKDNKKITHKVWLKTPRVGLEPTTQRLTAVCSTDWAIEEYTTYYTLKVKYVKRKLSFIIENAGDGTWTHTIIQPQDP